MLKSDGCIVASEGRGDDARELVRRRNFDVVLLDLFMTPVPGMEILKVIMQKHRDTLVVIMTGDASVETNIEALEAGAWEYMPKPFSATQLHILMGRAAHIIESRRAQSAPSEEATPQVSSGSRGVILGASPAFQRALSLARRVAATDASVVLIGESGTGKEMMARFIHAHSRRAKKTLLPVNCAALPDSLLESEMFGHKRGAFTGADRDKPGLLETAHEGTLLLDELTEMSASIQAKLLRVLQDGRIRRVGSETEEDRAVDVRIISATNRDPQQAVRDGILRQDLFFRLWVFPIQLPPLRERPEDIAHLARHFVTIYWMKHRGAGTRVPMFSREALDELVRRPWLGNVRELQNAMERLAVTAEPGQTIEAGDLPTSEELVQLAPAPSGIATAPLMTTAFHSAKEQLVTGFERTYLENLVQRADHNLSRAARLASIDRTTLYRLLEKHGLQRSDFIDAQL
jgi:DNA-binding NtrC family response regulator